MGNGKGLQVANSTRGLWLSLTVFILLVGVLGVVSAGSPETAGRESSDIAEAAPGEERAGASVPEAETAGAEASPDRSENVHGEPSEDSADSVVSSTGNRVDG